VYDEIVINLQRMNKVVAFNEVRLQQLTLFVVTCIVG